MSKKSKPQALYPYTLQPVALNLTEAEFKSAQFALFERSKNAYGLKSLRKTEWIVLAVMTVGAILGLIFVKNYSVILFWLMLILVALYLVVRTVGLKKYMEKEYQKQVDSTHLPDEMKDLKLGVQSHGLVISMPRQNIPNSKDMRGVNMQYANVQQGVIPWSAVSSWDETEQFLYIMFELQGQKGSQIIPKRLNPALPIDSIKKHLQETMPKGLKTDGMII